MPVLAMLSIRCATAPLRDPVISVESHTVTYNACPSKRQQHKNPLGHLHSPYSIAANSTWGRGGEGGGGGGVGESQPGIVNRSIILVKDYSTAAKSFRGLCHNQA